MKNKNLIGISGKINSGKDTVAKIIQWIIDQEGSCSIGEVPFGEITIEDCVELIESGASLNYPEETGWEIKKFADKLKDIVCLLIGCSRNQLEDREFKEKELGEEWWYYTNTLFYNKGKELVPYLQANRFIHNSNQWYIIKLTPRLLMQLLGTECGREILHPNVWINALLTDYKIIRHKSKFNSNDKYMGDVPIYPNWVITDVRFPNEVEAIKQRNGIAIRVNRDILLTKKGDPVKSDKSYNAEDVDFKNNEHPSETALDSYQDWDYIINNDSTILDLIQKVREILNKENII